ncbi:mucin-2 [Procambarus clarkii]|uniref:mucin-2 n=1 Tax=Procambarus clarkii TaxID=6728 RepID=UPI001E66FF63|nr:mucin-5AC-like [Procambarus clarkii]XP_045594388.1 mucin-5AC-like [Procambarus clarkii]
MTAPLRRVKLTELNAHLVCVLCSGYFVDATTIIECLHTFCKTCIVRYLQTSSFCPICDVQVHKTKPLLSLREDRTLQDVVFKLVPGLFHSEMNRRFCFYKEHPEAGGDKTEQSLRERQHFFHVDDQISLSLEHLPAPPALTHSLLHSHVMKPLKVSNGQLEKQKVGDEEKEGITGAKEEIKKEEGGEEREVNGVKVAHKRYLRCPAAVQVSHLEKFIRLKYSLAAITHKVDIMHGGDCLMGELTLLDVVYMYKWTEEAPLRLMYTVTAIPQSRKRPRPNGTRAPGIADPDVPPAKIPRTQSPSVNQTSHLQVSPHTPKGQDASRDQSERPSLTIADGDDMKMEVDKLDQDQLSESTSNAVIDKTISVPSVMPTADSVCPQTPSTVSNTSLVSNSGSSTNKVKPLTGSAPVRGRPALTTTTSATTTPRVALTRISTPVTPVSSTAVSVQVSEPIITSHATVTPPITMTNITTTTSHNSLGFAPVNARMHMSHSSANSITEAALKPVRALGPYINKMPQPIIPTRPRLGRPPNSSRINAATMKPPAPRLGDVRNIRPTLPGGKKMSPTGVSCRGNQTVSASLNVQSRLSSISGPPVKLGATKVSVKRSCDVIKDIGQTPSQPHEQVTNPPLSFSLPTNTSTTIGCQATLCLSDNLTTQSIPSNSPPTTSTNHNLETTLDTIDMQAIQMTPNTQVVQQTVKVQACQEPLETQAAQRLQDKVNKSPNQSTQRPGSQPNQRPNSQSNQPSSSTKANQRPQDSQINQRPSTTETNQHSPGTQSQRPLGTQASQRQTSNQQPTTINNQRPVTSASQHPATNASQRPATNTSQRPATNASQRPATNASQRPNTNANQRPATNPNLRPGGTNANQQAGTNSNKKTTTNTTQQSCSTQPSQECQSTQGNQQSPSGQTNQLLSGTQVTEQPSTTQASQRVSGTQNTQSSPIGNTMKRPINHVNQRLTNSISAQRPRTSVQHPSVNSVSQRSTSVTSCPPSPAPHRELSSPASHREPSSPAPHLEPSSPAPHLEPSSPAPHLEPSSPAPHREPSSPAPHREPSSPAPYREPSSPAPHREPSSPAPYREPSSPAPHREPSSPAPHRQPISSPAPHRQPSSSPAPHRQSGSTTPRPQNTISTSPVAGPTPKATPSPRTTSSPSTSTVSLTVGNKETIPVSTLANSGYVAGSSKSNSMQSGKSNGSKSSMAFSQARSAHPLGNSNVKSAPSKSQSTAGVKGSPKSPGRGRGSSGTPNILSIAQSLASRQLQQRTSTSTSTTTTTNVSAAQVGTHQAYTSAALNTNVYPNAIGGGLVSPALAAYMASAYGDPSALTDVTAMRNLITLSQTAACIREFNLAAMVKAAETLPRPSDPTPIDLSPTSKAAPQTPLTNGRTHTATAHVPTNTRTVASHTSKSPSSKGQRSTDTIASTTISPPTPEVTITKLPNTPASTSATGSGKGTLGSTKLGPTNTNTVSITKRPASSNRIAVAKSPANASVRQIPNPSFLRHQSEARNNNNVAKATSLSSASSSQAMTTSSSKAHSSTKQSTSSGRITGNSPLKETGPLPETSSILKIEHLTRSLAAPGSQAYRFFNDR